MGTTVTEQSAPTVVGVDVGGTFTDASLEVPSEPAIAVKVPTTDPPTAGVLESIQLACDRGDIEPTAIDQFRHGSTVATNALLERTGATTALVTTAGFRDVLEIGRQNRSSLYDLTATRPEPLVRRDRRYELAERTPPPDHPTPDDIRRPPDPSAVDSLVDELSNAESVAICLLHADVDASHETMVADHLREELDVPIVASSDIDPTVREYERSATTVASAYLTPVLANYLDGLTEECTSIGLPHPQIMQSNGGVAATERVTERAVSAVLSGPAAGVVGAASAADATPDIEASGYITLDMGGTSADVSLIEGEAPNRTTSTTVGGVPTRVPAVDVHTVGAGGGSIAWVDAGGALRVGPRSAGADPGPACYGRGGTEPTVTDAAVMLGIIDASRTFGRTVDIDRQRSVEVLDELASEAELSSPLEAAIGTYRIATETMTQAIRHVTVERGHDPRDDALIAFGGAGGMHATAIADRLDVDTVVVPPRAGLLSAAGLVGADERHDVAQGCQINLEQADSDHLESIFEELESEAAARCSEPSDATFQRTADLRYAGQSYELTVDIDTPVDVSRIREGFEHTHRQRRGYTLDDGIDVIACRLEAIVPSETATWQRDRLEWDAREHREVTIPPSTVTSFAVFEGMPPASAVEGPCIIEQPNTTVVVPPGWELAHSVPLTILTRRHST